MPNDVRQTALTYMRQHQVMTLATHGPQGLWAAALFYVNREFNLYFLSAGHTRHAQNMRANARVAATIQENYADWEAIKGIQLEGVVEQLAGEKKRMAMTLYKARYPFIANADATMQAALEKVNWYCLWPDRFYFIDNSQGFGHRDELLL